MLAIASSDSVPRGPRNIIQGFMKY